MPLVDLNLFKSRGFRWGTTLLTLVSFAMFGLMFAAPQYFQDARGTNALGSGIRLLPMIGGLVVGMVGGTRLLADRKGKPALITAKTAVAAGYVIMAGGLALGATTTVHASTGFAAAWLAVAGCGLGLAMPAAMNAALAALSAERSGAGSALISALRQVGATIGVAVLGTIISTTYSSALTLPAPVKAIASRSVAAGVEVAQRLRDAQMLENVRSAFVHGMDVMLWTSGGIALASAVLAVIFLPGRAAGLDA
jgi:DHA2 family multidrug resistance protein-like MFS transporter